MFSPISIDYSVISFKYYSIRMPKETLFSNSVYSLERFLTRIYHLFSIIQKFSISNIVLIYFY